MVDVIALFEDEKLPPEAFLGELGPEGLAAADAIALRAILRQQWERLLDAPTELDAKDLREWKAWRGYAFERITFKLLALEGLDPQPSYYALVKPKGVEEPTSISSLKRSGASR